MGDEAPSEVCEAARGLRYVSVRCVHLGVGRENLTEKHWIYYPEDTVFHRIFVQGNASPHCNPPGGFGLTCEITYSPHKPLPCDGDDLIQPCIGDCLKVGFFKPDDPVWAAVQVRYAACLCGLRSRAAEERRRPSATGWPSTTSCSPAATASGSITTPTMPFSPAKRRPRRYGNSRRVSSLAPCRSEPI